MELVIEQLYKKFKQKEVLKEIDFVFEQDKIYGLLGRNGSGKTTLFNCISQELDYESGAIFLQENHQRHSLELHDIGYVLSTPVVPEFLTGREFIQFFIDLHQGQLQNLKTPDAYFDELHIDVVDRDVLMKNYSHGMKNKMQMLINMIWASKVLLLDEPLTSFDLIVAQEMKEMLLGFKQGRIMILSTHILEVALDICDEIIVLVNGKLRLIDKQMDPLVFKESIIACLKEEIIDEAVAY